MKVILLIVVAFALYSVAQVSSPTQCESWYAGFSYNIEWDTTNLGDDVVIELYGDSTYLLYVASTSNDGSYSWEIPFIGNYSYTTCTAYINIRNIDDNTSTIRSNNFTLLNPIRWGSIDISSATHIADTLFKVRWWGDAAESYDLAYRKGSSGSVTTKSIDFDVETGENMQDYVISGLNTNTKYQFRMRYELSSGDQSEWTEWQEIETYSDIDCTNDFLAAWFSFEAYDNMRTGEKKYPGLCGTNDWKTEYAYTVSPDFVGVFASKNKGLVVVTYRGTTRSVVDFYENIGILAPCSTFVTNAPSSCNINSGIGGAYVAGAAETVKSEVDSLVNSGDYDTLLTTGHSQGGSISLLASIDFGMSYATKENLQVININFGTPQVGDQGFSDAIVQYNDEVTRYIQRDNAGQVDEATIFPGSAVGYLPPYFITGFIPIDVDPTYLPCPTGDSRCNMSGPNIVYPYYCHCLVGYYANIADISVQDSTNSPQSSRSTNTNSNGSNSNSSNDSSSASLFQISSLFLLFIALLF